MTDEQRIKPGDIVDVEFEFIQNLFRLKVLDIPSATGDCWKMENDDGDIIYIQQFSTMVRHKEII